MGLRGSLAVAALPLLALAGCSEAEVEPQVGLCVASPSESASALKFVPCDDPHTAQIVGIFDPVAGPFPGEALLSDEAATHCSESFEKFVGSDPLTSVLELYPLVPTESAWDAGETRVLCIAATYKNQLVDRSFESSHR